jgi:hypothetical protein
MVGQRHLGLVSDGRRSFLTRSDADSQARRDFLDGIRDRVVRARVAEKREEVVAGAIEGVRASVQRRHPDGLPVVLLYGPGDYDVAKIAGAGR